MEHLESPQLWWPPAAAGVTTTLTASWGAGTWAELVASAAVDAMLSCIVCDEASAAQAGDHEYDVGRGAAGVEVMVARVRSLKGATGDCGPNNHPFQALLYMIDAGDRVAVRARKNGSTNRTIELSIGYVTASAAIAAGLTYMGTGAGAGSQLKSMPDAAVSLVLTPNASAWANSAYTQFSAAVADDLILHHLTVEEGGTFGDRDEGCEIDIATGAAGVEVVKDTIRTGTSNTSGASEGGPRLALCQLFDGIASGARLALRMRKSGTNTSEWRASLGYFEKP